MTSHTFQYKKVSSFYIFKTSLTRIQRTMPDDDEKSLKSYEKLNDKILRKNQTWNLPLQNPLMQRTKMLGSKNVRFHPLDEKFLKLKSRRIKCFRKFRLMGQEIKWRIEPWNIQFHPGFIEIHPDLADAYVNSKVPAFVTAWTESSSTSELRSGFNSQFHNSRSNARPREPILLHPGKREQRHYSYHRGISLHDIKITLFPCCFPWSFQTKHVQWYLLSVRSIARLVIRENGAQHVTLFRKCWEQFGVEKIGVDRWIAWIWSRRVTRSLFSLSRNAITVTITVQ